MKTRDKIKFEKLEEMSLEEIILSGENGESNKVGLMVICTRPPQNVDVLAVLDLLALRANKSLLLALRLLMPIPNFVN